MKKHLSDVETGKYIMIGENEYNVRGMADFNYVLIAQGFVLIKMPYSTIVEVI